MDRGPAIAKGAAVRSPGMPTRMEQQRLARRRSAPQQVMAAVGRHATWIVLFSLPGIVLWWHVWTGHPSSTLTCACGDPAQQVWFMAWPAWALSHFTSVFFSHAVNSPHGANLLS